MSGSERVGAEGAAERRHLGGEGEAATVPPARDLLDGVEDLLDEIDDVLEENAEEFVRGYVQKGGQ